jgi:hypothetical protein
MSVTEDEVRREMVVQLDEALHGRTWARDMSPKEVWESLLKEVRDLKRSRGSRHSL